MANRIKYIKGLKLYLAHNYEAKEYLQTLKGQLTEAGLIVTSRWIMKTFNKSADDKSDALMDLEDIDKADILVMFANAHSVSTGRGKWFEFGYAYALLKPVVLIGDPDNHCVFSSLIHESNRYRSMTDWVATVAGDLQPSKVSPFI